MKIQNFSKSPFQSKHVAGKPFVAHGCDSLASYRAANPGRFIEQPATHERCADGFRFYQRDDGGIVALRLD